MSPIHRLQDLTIDFSRLGAVELQGEPLKSSSSAVKLSYALDATHQFHRIRFKKYSDAHKLYEEVIDRWMKYEDNRSRSKLIQAAERELAF